LVVQNMHMKRELLPETKCNIQINISFFLGFTALTGKPVLCLIMIAGIQQNLNVESEIDPFVTETLRDATDKDYFDRNFGTGKLFPGGPTCTFLGKDIPCMVRWSPKGSIT